METEQLKPAEFDAHMDAHTLRLAFIGMSNGGKSYRSRVLRDECDFMWYEVDAEIQKDLGFEDMDDISKWMQQPHTDGFEQRQQQYLASESRCTKLDHLDTGGRNLAFDTTGSFIYLDQDALDWLRDETLVVHIDVGEESIARMVRKYFEDPKPVVWGDMFNQEAEEDGDDALMRCFPHLLEDRLQRYRQFAHINIPLEELWDRDGAGTLAAIKGHLEQ